MKIEKVSGKSNWKNSMEKVNGKKTGKAFE